MSYLHSIYKKKLFLYLCSTYIAVIQFKKYLLLLCLAFTKTERDIGEKNSVSILAFKKKTI